MQLLTRNPTGKLVIELSRQTVSAAHVFDRHSRQSKVVIQRSLEKLDFADAEALAARLRSTLRVLNARPPFAVTVCLPRSVACIHVVELPRIDRRELVRAVNLEMEAVYGEECNQYIWDFVCIDADGSMPAYVVVFSVPKRIIETLRLAFDQSQIAVERITFSELGYGVVSSHYAALVHILALRQNRLDVMICYRGHVLQSQTFTINSTRTCDFVQILGVLRRLHASLPETLQTLVPTSMLVLAQSDANDDEETGEFESSLVAACQENEFAIEQLPLHELFSYTSSADQRPDLAHPRKAPSPPISRRSKATVLMAGLISAAIGYWVINQLELANLSKQIDLTQQKIADHERILADLDQQLESAAILNQWEESNVDWRVQIRAISQGLARTDDSYLVRLQMDNQNHQERKPVTRLEGRSKTPQKVLQLTRSLTAENPSLSIQPNGIEPNSVDPEFSAQFRVEIAEVAKQSSTEIETIRQD